MLSHCHFFTVNWVDYSLALFLVCPQSSPCLCSVSSRLLYINYYCNDFLKCFNPYAFSYNYT